jgi:hypothetical protein
LGEACRKQQAAIRGAHHWRRLGLFGIIEGIIYLTKSDDEFIKRYGIHRKSWF